MLKNSVVKADDDDDEITTAIIIIIVKLSLNQVTILQKVKQSRFDDNHYDNTHEQMLDDGDDYNANTSGDKQDDNDNGSDDGNYMHFSREEVDDDDKNYDRIIIKYQLFVKFIL